MSTLSAPQDSGFEFQESFHSSPSPQAIFHGEVPSLDGSKKPKRSRKPKSVNEKVERKLKNQKYQCKWDGCDLYFSDSATLKDHLEEHIGRGLSVYLCKWEGCNFGERKKRDHMKSHIRKHHQFVGFFCQNCGEGYVRDQELRKHICANPDGQLNSDSHAYYSDSSNTSTQLLPSSPSTSDTGSPSPMANLPRYYDSSKFNLHPLANFNYNSTLILENGAGAHMNQRVPQPKREPYSPPPLAQGNCFVGTIPSHQDVGVKRGREADDDDLLKWLSSLESGNVEPSCNSEVIYGLDSMMMRFEEEPACFDRLAPALSQHYPFFKKLKHDIEENGFSSDQDIDELFNLDDENMFTQPTMGGGMITVQENMVEKRGLVTDARLTFSAKPISFRRGGEDDSSDGTESEEEEEEESEEESEEEEEEEGSDVEEATQAFQKVSLAPRRRPRTVKELLDFIGTMMILGEP